MAQISSFRGLNNVSDSLGLGLGWLVKANDVDVTATGMLVRRDGYKKAQSAAVSEGYATIDTKRLFVVTGGSINWVSGDLATLFLIRAVTSSAPMYFAEVNQRVFYSNGTDYGIIEPDNSWSDWTWPAPDSPVLSAGSGKLPAGQYQVLCTFLLPDGRETGASEVTTIFLPADSSLQMSALPIVAGLQTAIYVAPAYSTIPQFAMLATSTSMAWDAKPETLGMDLVTAELNQVPSGTTVIQHWGGVMFAAQPMQRPDQTVIWKSEPLGYHLFKITDEMFMIPGEVVMMAPHKDALIVGTRTAIWAYSNDGLKQLATYGVVPGHPWVRDGDDLLIWTLRGLCSALPFQNRTDRQVSVPPGARSGAALIEKTGVKRFVVALQKGGTAYNARNPV